MISRLHFITQDLPSRTHVQLTRLAAEGGIDWVQLRLKKQPADNWQTIASETAAVCKEFGVRLIINDQVSLALECGAAGVHLGKKDMAVEEARKILGPSAIIGATANTFQDLERIADSSANYVGLGPFRFTATKENLSPILGLDGIASLCQRFRKVSPIPVIGIGGIQLQDIESLMKTGLHGIAVSSAIGQQQDMVQSAGEFVRQVERIGTLNTPLK
jgi:thiamine-phosphate pyrophosphorylase